MVVSPENSVSNTTTDWPSRPVASKVNSTSTVPLDSLGMKVASEVTCWSFTNKGSLVSLSIRTPVSLYPRPTVRPLYSTVSVMVICSAGWAVFSPFTVAVVPI